MATIRPDLASAAVKFPNYITPRVFPFHVVQKKVGNLYYADIQADTTAQTARTITDSPTSATIVSSNVAFALDQNDEAILDIQIPDSEIELLGGVARAEQKGARKAKRSVMNWLEAISAANILANGTATVGDILDSLKRAIDIAKEQVADYADGQIALVGSQYVINRVKRYAEVIDRMKHTGVLLGSVRDVRSVSNEQLAAALDVDVILGGPKAIWYDPNVVYQDRLALCVLPNPDVDADEEIQLGRTVCFPVEGDGTNIEISTFSTDRPAANWVRGRMYAEQKVLNVEAMYILDGIDESNTVVTTGA